MPLRATSALLVLLIASSQLIAEPQVRDLSLRGLTIGAATSLTIRGAQLGSDPQVVLGIPGAVVEIGEGSHESQLNVLIELPPECQPGRYPLRVASRRGISEAVSLIADELRQAAFSPKIDSLPVAMTGQLTGSTILESQFQGVAGQTILIDVEAERIGSRLRPLVRLLDDRGSQIAFSSRESALGGDARISAELPADGLYTIQLHDAEYQGPGPGFFRLKVGNFRVADFALPPAAATGDAAPTYLNIHGNAADADPIIPQGGSLPPIRSSDLTELVEPLSQSPASRKGDPPVAISGVLSEDGQRDEFEVQVSPKSKYRVEVFAQRLGSPLDAVLEVRKSDGGMLATADDQKDSSDPAVAVDVPDGIDRIKVSVHELTGIGSPVSLYRLVVTPLPWPDFQLQLNQDRVHVPQGGSAVVEVVAVRRNFAGPIQIEFPDLPAGVVAELTEIPAAADRALVSLTASSDAAGFVVGTVVGKATIGDREIVRQAAIGSQPVLGLPTAAADLAVAVDQAPPLTVAFQTPRPEVPFNLGQSSGVPVRVARAEGTKGPVRLTLVSSQVTPMANNKPDPAKALLLKNAPTLKGEAAEADLQLQVPVNLQDISYDVAIQAELLSDDKKNVRYTTTTPAVRLSLQSKLHLALTGQWVLKLQGKINRAEGFVQPVKVSAVGLPKEAKAPDITVPSDKTDFVFEIEVPASVKPDQLAKVKLVAKVDAADESPSNEVPVSLRIVP